MTGKQPASRPGTPTTRAITHIHTHWSPDSRLKHGRLGEILTAAGVDLAIVSDHDTFGGSVAFASHCESEGLPITVPVASEIRTDRGDVLVVLEPGTEPPAVSDILTWDRLVDVVRGVGGVVGLPHPYRSHEGVEELASACDFIEVFNARTSEGDNQRAAELCAKVGAYRSYGVDAHLAHEVTRAVVEYPEQPTVAATLRQHASCHDPELSPRSDKAAAEVINGIAARRPLLAAYFAAVYLRHKPVELVRRR